MKKNIVSRTLSVHKEHELLLKLEAAGLTDVLAQRIIDSRDNALAKRFIRLISDEPVEKILEQIGTVRVKGAANFVAREKFREGYTVDGVSIASLSGSFQMYFLDMIEFDADTIKLKIYKLLKAARDVSMEGERGIIPEIGSKHEILLTHFFHLLAHKQETKDFTGVVAYILGRSSKLYAVDADWHPGFGFGGWRIHATPITSKSLWNREIQVVSR